MSMLVLSLNKMIMISIYLFLIFLLNSERKTRDFGPRAMVHNSFKGLFNNFLFPNLFYSIL